MTSEREAKGRRRTRLARRETSGGGEEQGRQRTTGARGPPFNVLPQRNSARAPVPAGHKAAPPPLVRVRVGGGTSCRSPARDPRLPSLGPGDPLPTGWSLAQGLGGRHDQCTPKLIPTATGTPLRSPVAKGPGSKTKVDALEGRGRTGQETRSFAVCVLLGRWPPPSTSGPGRTTGWTVSRHPTPGLGAGPLPSPEGSRTEPGRWRTTRPRLDQRVEFGDGLPCRNDQASRLDPSWLRRRRKERTDAIGPNDPCLGCGTSPRVPTHSWKGPSALGRS